MDYRFRVEENRPSTYFPSPSSDNYFTEQALRAGYITDEIRRNEFGGMPISVKEDLLREIEKERIRDDIIIEEIARKRVLEAEVRRELLMERELALRRAGEGFHSRTPSSSFLFSRAEPRDQLMLLENSIKLEEKLPFQSVADVERFPLQRRAEIRVSEIKPSLSAVSKGQVTFLARPTNLNHAGTKRKALSISELLEVGSKKKAQKEWNCALCQVSATSESGLNDHLQGKKHMAKQAELSTNRMTGKNTGSSTPLPKKTDKPSKLTKINGNLNFKQGEKKEVKGEKVMKNGESSQPKKQKKEITQMKKLNAPKQKKKGNSIKKSKLWCVMCKVEANSESMMDHHRKGKKHLAQLLEMERNSRSVSATTTTSTTTRVAVNVKAKNAIVKTMKNTDGEVDGVENAADGKEDVGTAKEMLVSGTIESNGTEEPEQDSVVDGND